MATERKQKVTVEDTWKKFQVGPFTAVIDSISQ